MKKKNIIIPDITLKRLSHYMHYLSVMQDEGEVSISSTKMSDDLLLDPIQIRKDIQYTGIVGKPKTGYDLDDLIDAIKDCLHWNDYKSALIAGVGNLGSAMLGYKFFERYGFHFEAAFDYDKSKIGTKINGVEVHDVKNIARIARKYDIKIGVVAVPNTVAQAVVDAMLDGGVIAIWNFAPHRVRVPETAVVEHAQFSQSLAVLTRKLSILTNTDE